MQDRSPNPRAPRLAPDEYIAPYITRIGRFRKINPLKARKLPSVVQILGVVGWAALLEESFRRARRSDRAQEQAHEQHGIAEQ